MNYILELYFWFQEFCCDLDGLYGDYYVWSDISECYIDVWIIFVDIEELNWLFDFVC